MAPIYNFSSSTLTSPPENKSSMPTNHETSPLEADNSASYLSAITLRSLKKNGRQDVITKYMARLDKIGDVVLNLQAQGKKVQLIAREIKELEVKMKNLENESQGYKTMKKELARREKEWKRLDDNWTAEAEKAVDQLVGFMEESSKIEVMAHCLEKKACCGMKVKGDKGIMQGLMVVCRNITQFFWKAAIFAGRFR